MSKLKAKIVLHKMLANTGKQKTMAKAMTEAGYKPGYAKNPHSLERTRTWLELMDEYLPESELARVHKEMLAADRPVVCDKEIELYPDNDARLKATDMGYKLRGKYAPEQIDLTTRKYQSLTDAELAAVIKKQKDKLLNR